MLGAFSANSTLARGSHCMPLGNAVMPAATSSVHAFSTRLNETGTGVRSSWANSDTRSSSSSQRNASSRGDRGPPRALGRRALAIARPPLRRPAPHGGRRAPGSARYRCDAPRRAPAGSAASGVSCAHGVAARKPGIDERVALRPDFGREHRAASAGSAARRCDSAWCSPAIAASSAQRAVDDRRQPRAGALDLLRRTRRGRAAADRRR